MAINLTTKVVPYTDEVFAKESKKSLLTNSDFDWVGAHTIKVYKISTVGMNDYNRSGADDNNWSRYGAVAGLDATTEEMTLKKIALSLLRLISWMRMKPCSSWRRQPLLQDSSVKL